MRSPTLAMVVLSAVLTGCGGGGSPELYALVFDVVTAPASCYANPPATTVTGVLGTLNAEVWDGPEGKAYLTVEGGSLSVDMGDAPTVTVSVGQAIEGSPAAGGWSFITDRTQTTTTPIIGTVTTVKTRAELTFARASTAKGTLSLSSSQTCTGTGCPGTMPTCSITGAVVRATRLNVAYEKAP
ncbi:MAG: hypothetical protein JNK82_11050 [Myxococcaceae bacterium]|nr:hypothetical protein [Myxococcaceae bacterium]